MNAICRKGYIIFNDPAALDKAMETKDEYKLDGRRLYLDYCDNRSKRYASGSVTYYYLGFYGITLNGRRPTDLSTSLSSARRPTCVLLPNLIGSTVPFNPIVLVSVKASKTNEKGKPATILVKKLPPHAAKKDLMAIFENVEKVSLLSDSDTGESSGCVCVCIPRLTLAFY